MQNSSRLIIEAHETLTTKKFYPKQSSYKHPEEISVPVKQTSIYIKDHQLSSLLQESLNICRRNRPSTPLRLKRFTAPLLQQTLKEITRRSATISQDINHASADLQKFYELSNSL